MKAPLLVKALGLLALCYTKKTAMTCGSHAWRRLQKKRLPSAECFAIEDSTAKVNRDSAKYSAMAQLQGHR
jgi:hypothetical protein